MENIPEHYKMSTGFLHMDLIPNTRIFPKDPGGPGHYWAYINSDMNDLNNCDAHFDEKIPNWM